MTPFQQLCTLAVIAVGGQFLWGVVRRKRMGRLLNPQPPQENVLYRETFGSGHSLGSGLSSIFWASRCLRIVVTSERLWIAPFFPFNLTPSLHLEYDIPRSSILTIKPGRFLFRKTAVIEFLDAARTSGRLELIVRDFTAFFEAFGILTP